jgi:hydroxymethylbilane synthase
VTAERALLARLGGGCHVPIGAYARVEDNALILDAFIADPSGINMVRRQRRGAPEDAENIGALLGETLLSEGGAEILDALNTETADEND